MGTLLSLVDQADVVVAGRADDSVAAEVAADYAVPFLTSSTSCLLAVQCPSLGARVFPSAICDAVRGPLAASDPERVSSLWRTTAPRTQPAVDSSEARHARARPRIARMTSVFASAYSFMSVQVRGASRRLVRA